MSARETDSVPDRQRAPEGRSRALEDEIVRLRAENEELRRYQLIAEHSRDIILFLRREDGRILEANVAATAVYGYQHEELVGLTIDDLCTNDGRASIRGPVDEADAGGILFEAVHRRKNGTTFPVEISLQGGTVGGTRTLISVIRDITERRQAQEALRASEERLVLAQSAADIGAWEWRVCPGEVIGTDALWRIYGLQPRSAPWTEGLWLNCVHPADRERTERAFADSLLYSQFSSVDFRILQPNGEIRWISSRWRIYRNEEGKAVRAVGTSLDVTDLKQAESANERARVGMAHLVETSARVVGESSLHGLMQVVAQAARELTGASIAACGHVDEAGRLPMEGVSIGASTSLCRLEQTLRPRDWDLVARLLKDKEAIRLTGPQMCVDAGWQAPEDNLPSRGLLAVGLVGSDQCAGGMVLVVDKQEGDFTSQDESLLRQLGTIASLAMTHIGTRMRLEEADRNRTEFLSMLSHELRNPLAPICNSLFVLDRVPAGGEEAQRAKAVIDRQVRHLSRIVDDLLDATRISSGKLKLQRARIELVETLRRTAEDYRSAFVSRGIALRECFPNEPCWVDADPTRIAQIVGNLLQNAVKFTAQGGVVVLTLREDESTQMAEIRVCDNGIGIRPSVLPRLFEPFTQAKISLDRGSGGLGLGLALVRRLAEMHGGHACVHSDGLGKGAEFTVCLPLDRTVGPPRPAPHHASGRVSRRLLVIEDNVDAADSLRDVLELEGHQVAVTHSGPEGLRRAREFKPDVVLCDIGLPGMDGYAVARECRSDESLRVIYLIALTGYASPQAVSDALKAGFDQHLPKPPDLEQLEQILADLPVCDRTATTDQ